MTQRTRTPETERPTIKAVLAYVVVLQERAVTAMNADPDARPYYPTTAGARQMVTRTRQDLIARYGLEPGVIPEDATLRASLDAPAFVLQRLASKARAQEIAMAEQAERSNRARKRHRRRAEEARRDREAFRANRTIGQRLDAALAALSTIAASDNVQAWNPDHTTGTKDQPLPRFPGDPMGRARQRALEAVRFVENELDDARRRRVELEAA